MYHFTRENKLIHLLSLFNRGLYTNQNNWYNKWCMEEWPTACTPQETTARSEKYFQIKDDKTGFVLGLSDDFKKAVFSENKGMIFTHFFFKGYSNN